MSEDMIFCIYVAIAVAIWIAAFFFDSDTEEAARWAVMGLFWPVVLAVVVPVTLLMIAFDALGELHHRFHKAREKEK